MKKLLTLLLAFGMMVSCEKEENTPAAVCKTCQDNVLVTRSTGNTSSYVQNLGIKCGTELKELEGKSWSLRTTISQTQWQKLSHHITCY